MLKNMLKDKERIREVVSYLIFGVLTTVVSLALYYGLVYTVLNPEVAWQLQLANVISWVGSVLFAYVTNRKFVFHSTNENKLREAGSFFGARIITLVMDMIIMFLGVTLWHFNDKIVKLASQVIVIVANYVFSKLFVFRNKQKEKKSKKKHPSRFIVFAIFLIPVFDILGSFFQSQELFLWISLGYKVVLLSYFLLALLLKKKHIGMICLTLLGIIVLTLFSYTKGFDVLSEVSFLVSTFTMFLSILYFLEYPNKYLNSYFIMMMFFAYLLIFGVFYFVNPVGTESFYYAKREMIGVLAILMPLTYQTLIAHKNYFTKIVGMFLLFLGIFLWKSIILASLLVLVILYYLVRNRKQWKEQGIFAICFFVISFVLLGGLLFLKFDGNFPSSYFLDVHEEKITSIQNEFQTFETVNLEEQIFGVQSMHEVTLKFTGVDFVDIFYRLGYFGIGLYALLFLILLCKMKHTVFNFFGLLFLVCISVLSGHIFISFSIGVLLGVVMNAGTLKEKRRILLVSNMYPSKRYKHYGSFVKNSKEQLESNGFQVDIAVKKKKVLFIFKFFDYICFYISAIFQSFLKSYDYYYVHYISHSGLAVLPAKAVSPKTILVCNAHGNDVVVDLEDEMVNVKRSKFVLKYTNHVIVPSFYFKDVIIHDYGYPENQVTVYPSGGVNTHVFHEMSQDACREELGLDKKTTYIGMVSRIEKNKGYDTLLDAIHLLKKEPFMKHTKLIVIGTGEEQSEFHSLIDKYHLKDVVIQKDFVYQTELVKYYNAFDVMIFPTKRKSESLGLVGLEAMACKTPLIACNLYGPREYAVDGENSLTYQDIKDGKELAKKIKEFFHMKESEKQKLIDNAFETAQKYDVLNSNDLLKDVFQ